MNAIGTLPACSPPPPRQNWPLFANWANGTGAGWQQPRCKPVPTSPSHPHHQRILRVLQWLNADLLRTLNIYFGGGTALVFVLGEYRRSDDIDLITNHLSIAQNQISLLNARHGPRFLVQGNAPEGVEIGPFRAHRDKYAGSFMVDGHPIRFEIIYESRVPIRAGDTRSGLPICHVPLPVLAEMKWHALLDRGLDKGVHHRDLYDLAMMAYHGVDITAALQRATQTLAAVPEVCRKVFLQADNYRTRRDDYQFLNIADDQAANLYQGLCKVAQALSLPPASPFFFEVRPGQPDIEIRLPPSDFED